MKGVNPRSLSKDEELRRKTPGGNNRNTRKQNAQYLNDSDRALLRKVYDPMDPRNLVMQKSKRRATYRTTSSKRDSRGLLDASYLASAESLLKLASSWKFNIFALDRLTSGRPIFSMGLYLFQKHNVLAMFKLDVVKLCRTLRMIEDMYHSRNPYHNAMHAGDVTQAMYCYLLEEKLKAVLSPFDFLFSIMAAMCHDLDHPGVNQVYLEKTSNYLAHLYENSSVLEKHHWKASVAIFHETRLFAHFSSNQWNYFRECFAKLILATDISQQQQYLMTFSSLVGSKRLDVRSNSDHKTLVLQMALKCADIGNPCREWSVCCSWANLVCEEFFRQGDRERRQNLPIVPTMDRYTTTKPKVQTGFIKFLVKPLFDDWHSYMRSSLSAEMKETIDKNLTRWEQKQNKAANKENHHNNNNNNSAAGATSSTDTSGAGSSSASDSAVLLSYATQAPLVSLEPLQEENESPVSQLKTLATADRRHSLPGNLVVPPGGNGFPRPPSASYRNARRRGSLPKAAGLSPRLPILDQVTLDVSADVSDSPSSVASLSPPSQAATAAAQLRDLSNVNRVSLTRQILSQPAPPLEVLMQRRGSAPAVGSMAMASLLLRTAAITAANAGTAAPISGPLSAGASRRRSQSVDLDMAPLPRCLSLTARSAGSLANTGGGSIALDMLMGSLMNCARDSTLSVHSIGSTHSTSPLAGELSQ